MSLSGSVTAVLGKDLAHALGKKGTSSDITLYNHKLSDTILSFAEPSSYPEKIHSLLSCLNMADQVLLKVDEINAYLAETIVALDAAGASKGYLIVSGNVALDNLKNITQGSVIWSYPTVEDQVVAVREKLAELKIDAGGDAIVQVDHSFPVKGVGTVALGVVKSGVVKKHDEFIIYPKRKKVAIKSIQVHDTDVPEAAAGVRVGLAIKDITPEDIPRGVILSTSESIQTANSLEVDVTLSKYSKRPIAEGDSVMVNAFLNYIPAKVVSGAVNPGASGKVKLSLEKELTMLPGRIILLDPGQKMPRVFGFGKI